MAPPQIIQRFRDQMQARWDRANRRMVEILAKNNSEGVSVEIGDAFAQLASELKNIRHDFGGFCAAVGLPKMGNKKLEQWSSTLAAEDAKAFNEIAAVRDYEIHTEPVKATYPGYLRIRVADGRVLTIKVKTHILVVSGRRQYQLDKFCRQGMDVYRRFIAEFHTLV